MPGYTSCDQKQKKKKKKKRCTEVGDKTLDRYSGKTLLGASWAGNSMK